MSAVHTPNVLSLFLKEEREMARRRGQRTGYVYRRGNSWFGQFRIDTMDLDEKGRFERKTLTKFIAPAAGPGKIGKRRAQVLFYDEHLKELQKSGPMSSRTVAQFVSESFEPQVAFRCKSSGRSHYAGMLKNHVLPALGSLLMRDVRPEHVWRLIQGKLDWRGERDKRLSIQTVTHIRNTVTAVFHHAKRMRAYSGDLPTEGLKLPPLIHAERRALTWNQVQAIASVIGYPDPSVPLKKKAAPPDLENCAANNLQLGALVRILALTGLRIGEAMGLRWKHVDLDLGIIAVRESFVRGEYGTLKTQRSWRDVPLHSVALAELRNLRGPGPADPDAPVFAGRNSGKPLDQHNIAARYLRPAGKRAGCPWVGWHVLRHTAATLTHAVGLSIEQRQKVLGHAAQGMTVHYTHPELEAVRVGLEKIGRERVD